MGIYDHNGDSLNSAYSKSGSVLSAAYAYDGTQIFPSSAGVFLDTAIVTALPSITHTGVKQGACTDGVYIYQFSQNTASVIIYNIAEGTYTTKGLGWSVPYRHGNDMAYNPNNEHIFLAAMTDDGAVMELDHALNYVQTHYLQDLNGNSFAVWALCFDQNTRHFLADYGTLVLVYDEQFDLIGSIPSARTVTGTAQGMETDGDYIYRVWYNPNKIEVASITGPYVTTITNPMTGEPEAMMYDWINDRYFMSKNTSTDVFYGVQLKQQ